MTTSAFSFTALVLVWYLVLSACGGGDDTLTPPVTDRLVVERSVASLRLIGQQVLPRRMEFSGSLVGGLSGIDYDAANNRYVLVSDDRTTTDSATAPRMYFASLAFDVNTFSGVTLASTFTMKQPNGSVYLKMRDVLTADPETVRFDPVSGNLLWVSEGQHTVSTTAPATNVLIQPFVHEITPTGTHVREYLLPSNFQITATDSGPRGNAVFEGLSITPDRSKTVVIAEGPLFQDGAASTVTTGATSRITVFDRATGLASAQYAYPIERVQATPVPADQFTVNGPTEILAVINTKFLVAGTQLFSRCGGQPGAFVRGGHHQRHQRAGHGGFDRDQRHPRHQAPGGGL